MISFNLDPDQRLQPILIRRIEVTGVAFTSSCTACPAGTYSDKGKVSQIIACIRAAPSELTVIACRLVIAMYQSVYTQICSALAVACPSLLDVLLCSQFLYCLLHLLPFLPTAHFQVPTIASLALVTLTLNVIRPPVKSVTKRPSMPSRVPANAKRDLPAKLKVIYKMSY